MYSNFGTYRLPESDLRANDQGHGPHGFTNGYNPSSQDPLTYTTYPPPQSDAASDLTKSPTPSNRLAGEPAYCAGRHCCQWTVNGCVCNNHYPSAEDLDRHIATDHAGKHWNGQPSGDYHCHWAGCSKTESFGNKPKLTRHIHSHTCHKPHQCPYPGCGKGFVTKEQLKNHETTHTKTREHVCPECGKGFAVKTALTSHMNVHKGAKPYICDECGKGFADSSNLSKHKAIHKRTGLKRSHTRRQSSKDAWMSADATPSLLTSPVGSESMASNFPYTPDSPSQSIEKALQDYCGPPCFDALCTQTQPVIPCRSASPCKSAPCSNRECSPSCIEPCDAKRCEGSDCHALPICDAQDCFQDCGLTNCGLPDCNFQDCFQDCALHPCSEQLECFCVPTEGHTTASSSRMSMSSSSHMPTTTVQPVSTQGEGFASTDWNFDTRVTANSGGGFDGVGEDGGLSEGFKQLSEFVHGDFCNCVDGC